MTGRRGAVAVLAGLALALVGCIAPTEGTDVERGGEQATVREDPEPITRRFSALGEITRVHWLGGTDDGRVPGPTTYTIQAVIVLASDDVARLAGEYDLRPVAAPAAPAPLADLLPAPASWAAAEELDQAIGRESLWNTDIALDVGSGVAYLSAQGRS